MDRSIGRRSVGHSIVRRPGSLGDLGPSRSIRNGTMARPPGAWGHVREAPRATYDTRLGSGGVVCSRGPIEPGGPAIRGELGGSGGAQPPADRDRPGLEWTGRRDLPGRSDRRRRRQDRIVARGGVQARAVGEPGRRGRWGGSLLPRRGVRPRRPAAARRPPASRAALAGLGVRSGVERPRARHGRRLGLPEGRASDRHHDRRQESGDAREARGVGGSDTHGRVGGPSLRGGWCR